MEKKKCYLCVGVARVYCESDEASLCWDCDGKVHGANFLAAKHTRCLLCSACHSPTPWNASGPRLGPTLSNCESCFQLFPTESSSRKGQEINYCGGDWLKIANDRARSYNDDEGDEKSDENDKEEEEAENLVVDCDAVVASSSSVSSGRDPVAKRTRRVIDLNRSYEEDDDSNDFCPLKLNSDEASSSSVGYDGFKLEITRGDKNQ